VLKFVDHDCFESACASTEPINFGDFSLLFDKNRKRNLLEKYFTPSKLNRCLRLASMSPDSDEPDSLRSLSLSAQLNTEDKRFLTQHSKDESPIGSAKIKDLVEQCMEEVAERRVKEVDEAVLLRLERSMERQIVELRSELQREIASALSSHRTPLLTDSTVDECAAGDASASKPKPGANATAVNEAEDGLVVEPGNVCKKGEQGEAASIPKRGETVHAHEEGRPWFPLPVGGIHIGERAPPTRLSLLGIPGSISHAKHLEKLESSVRTLMEQALQVRSTMTILVTDHTAVRSEVQRLAKRIDALEALVARLARSCNTAGKGGLAHGDQGNFASPRSKEPFFAQPIGRGCLGTERLV